MQEVELLRKIRRLSSYCGMSSVTIDKAFILDSLVKKKLGKDYEVYSESFIYDIFKNYIIVTCISRADTDAGGRSLSRRIHLEPNKTVLRVILLEFQKISKKKAIDDYLSEIANIKITEIMNGRGLILEKYRNKWEKKI